MLESLQSMLRGAPGFSRQFQARRLLIAAACSTLFYSTWASALGLGEITLQSALGQPFRGEIQLVEAGGFEEGELSVSLANAQTFSQAGVERVFFLNDLRFTPVLRGNRSVIRVESTKVVTEPFLNFIVQINRPNGSLVHEYTVLLDPPGTVVLPKPTSNTASANQGQKDVPRQQAKPAALPPATQGNHYTVVQGDTLWVIAKRLKDAGSKPSATELMQGIRALNNNVDKLSLGQSLLLPDSAVVAPVAAAVAPVAAPTAPEQSAEELAASVLENQQLQKNLAELQAKVLAQDEQLAGSHKEVIELQTLLAEVKTAPPTPAQTATPVGTPAPVVVTPAPEESDSSNLLLLAAVAVLLLLLALGLYVRRQRQTASAVPEPSPAPVPTSPEMVSRVVSPAEPAQVSSRVEPVLGAAAVAATAAAAGAAAAPKQDSGESSDALDGVNIYIAYGRFTEAQGILRDAIAKEPERVDLRLRLLEVLAKQGDAQAYAVEEQALLDEGFDAGELQHLRSLHPNLAAAAQTVPELPVSLPETAVPLSTKPVASDEFQLNLDDLSMDADWDLVSPFAIPPTAKTKPVPEVAPIAPEPAFASNLKELPEVFEMPDEQFLSDFADPEPVRKVELSLLPEDGALYDDFLDSFKDAPDRLDLEPLSVGFEALDPVDFEALDREQQAAEKLEQAQSCLDKGDQHSAGQLLQELLDTQDSPEPLKQVARTLLKSIR